MLDEEGRTRLEAAYREDGPSLWRAIFVFAGGRRDVTDEAVAEAFVQAATSLANIRDLRAWLYKSAFKIAAGELKHRPVSPSAYRPSDDQGVLDILDLARSLTPSQRRAFVLRDVLGFPSAEAARLMGTSDVAARVHVHNARKRLRTRLEEAER
jgi:DNA-directed RNA polymerase specialized sigma24 family protein